MTDRDRYNKAAHAMQSGVAMTMNKDKEPTEPKHLRVGINSALVTCAALASLLISKGVFTLEEYAKANANEMENEVKRFEARLSDLFGANITLS